MPRSYVIHTGSRDEDFRVIGPFPSKKVARLSPFSRLPGAKVFPLLPPRATLPEGIETEDPRPYCAECGSRDVETVEWVRCMPDGSHEVSGESPIDDTYCPECDENDLGYTFDPSAVRSPRRRRKQA